MVILIRNLQFIMFDTNLLKNNNQQKIEDETYG
jgi:hypothetical protein